MGKKSFDKEWKFVYLCGKRKDYGHTKYNP